MGAHFETQLYINYIYKIAQYTIKRVNSVLEYSIFKKEIRRAICIPVEFFPKWERA